MLVVLVSVSELRLGTGRLRGAPFCAQLLALQGFIMI